MTQYTPPTYGDSAFNCPNCGAYAHQEWQQLVTYTTTVEEYATNGARLPIPVKSTGNYLGHLRNLEVSKCLRCENYALWLHGKMLHPHASVAPPPSPDLPDDLKEDYQEAAAIVNKSPRGAAALLRLVLQKLMVHLGEPGKDINIAIGGLVKKGLPVQIQRAADAVRVIGNESVHPGTLDLKDDQETALTLFALINLIVQDRITQPKEIEALYNNLPPGKLQGIQDRDNKGKP